MILDTNALSAFIDGDAVLGAILRTSGRAAIPVIVLGEFRYGIANSRHRSTYESWLQEHLTAFDVLSVTAETTHAYASIRVQLTQQGRPIPANDVWIAALAVEHDMPVMTRDQHFESVAGIKRVSW